MSGSVRSGHGISRVKNRFLPIRAVVPVAAKQLHTHGSLNGISVIVLGDGGRANRVANLIDIAFAGDSDRERTVCSDDGVMSRDFAIGSVCNARFDAVPHIPM